MPQREVIAAIIERFNTFVFAGKPLDLWPGVVPLKRVDGSAVDLPVAAITDEGGQNTSTFEHSFLTAKTVGIVVVAESKAATITAALGILFNGGAVNGGLGLHYADGLPFAANTYVFKSMHLTNDPQYTELADRTGRALRAWQTTLKFEVLIHFTG